MSLDAPVGGEAHQLPPRELDDDPRVPDVDMGAVEAAAVADVAHAHATNGTAVDRDGTPPVIVAPEVEAAPQPPRKIGRWLAAGAATVGLAVGGYFLTSGSSDSEPVGSADPEPELDQPAPETDASTDAETDEPDLVGAGDTFEGPDGGEGSVETDVPSGELVIPAAGGLDNVSAEAFLEPLEREVLTYLKDGGAPFGQEWGGPTLEVPTTDVGALSVVPDGAFLDGSQIAGDSAIAAAVGSVADAECARIAVGTNLRDALPVANAMGHGTVAEAIAADPGFATLVGKMEDGSAAESNGFRRVGEVTPTLVERSAHTVRITADCQFDGAWRGFDMTGIVGMVENAEMDPFTQHEIVSLVATYDLNEGTLQGINTTQTS